MRADGKGSQRSPFLTSLMLSTFLYPGSGQLYLKRKMSGMVIIFLTSMFLVLFCLDLLHTLQQALPDILVETEGMDVVQQFIYIQGFVHSRMDLSASGFYLLLLIAMWLISIVDIIWNKE